MQLHLPKLDWLRGLRVAPMRALQWVLLSVLALQVARLAWLIAVLPAPIGEPRAAATAVAPTQAGNPGLDPFFPADSGSTQTIASGVTLHGITSGPGGASAILGAPEHGQVSLRVGESLQAGIRLVEIAGDYVVIESGEGRQRLGFGTGQAAAQVPSSLPSAAPVARTAPAALDPVRLLEQAGLAPRETEGQLSGYSVVPRGDGALLRQAGLQAGDVLLSVNGQSLTPERYQDLAKEMAGRPSVELTFERNGATQSITVPLQ